MLWTNDIEVTIVDFNDNFIDCYISCDDNIDLWRAIDIHGISNHNKKLLTCDFLNNLYNKINLTSGWCLGISIWLYLKMNKWVQILLIYPQITTMFRITMNNCNLKGFGLLWYCFYLDKQSS